MQPGTGTVVVPNQRLASGCWLPVVQPWSPTALRAMPTVPHHATHHNTPCSTRALVPSVSRSKPRLVISTLPPALACPTRSFAWAAAALLSTCATACKALVVGMRAFAIKPSDPVARHVPHLDTATARETLLQQLTQPEPLVSLAKAVHAAAAATDPAAATCDAHRPPPTSMHPAILEVLQLRSRQFINLKLPRPSDFAAFASAATAAPPSPALPCHGASHLGLLAWSARLAQDVAWLVRQDLVSYKEAEETMEIMRGMGAPLPRDVEQAESRYVSARGLVAALETSSVLEALTKALRLLPPLPGGVDDGGNGGGSCDAGCVLVPGVGCGRADAAELVCAVCSLGSCCHSLGVLLGEVCGGEGALRHEPLGLRLAAVLMFPDTQMFMTALLERAVRDVEAMDEEGRREAGSFWDTGVAQLLDHLQMSRLLEEAMVGSVPPEQLEGVEQLSVRGAQGQGQQRQQQRAPGVGRELAHATLLCGPLTVWTCMVRMRFWDRDALFAAIKSSSLSPSAKRALEMRFEFVQSSLLAMQDTCRALRATCLLYRHHPHLRARPPCGAVQRLWVLRVPMPVVYGCSVHLKRADAGPTRPRTAPLLTALDAEPAMALDLIKSVEGAMYLPVALEAAAWGLAAACDIGLQERAVAASAATAAAAGGTEVVPEWSWVAKSLVAGLWAAVGAVDVQKEGVGRLAEGVAGGLARARLLRSLDTFVRLYGDAAFGPAVDRWHVMAGLCSAVRALCALAQLPLLMAPGAEAPSWFGTLHDLPLVQRTNEGAQQKQVGDLCGLLLSMGKWATALVSGLEAAEGAGGQQQRQRQQQQQQQQQEGYRRHMLVAHALDELVGGLVVAVDRAARLAGEMEEAAAAAAASGDAATGSDTASCSTDQQQRKPPAEPDPTETGSQPPGIAAAAAAAAAASLRGCVVFACRAACWAASPRLEAACRVLRELPEGGRWPEVRPDDADSSASPAEVRIPGLPSGARLVRNPMLSPRKRSYPSLQVPVSYPTRGAYLQGAANTLSTTAGWLGCPLGAWLGEWRQLLPARPMQLLEGGCKFVAVVAGEVGTGRGPQGAAPKEEHLRLLVQGVAALHGVLVGLATHGDNATVEKVSEWLADAAVGGSGSDAGGRKDGFELADLTQALEDAVGAAGKAGGPGVRELRRSAAALSLLLQVLEGAGGQVAELRRVAQQVRAAGGAEGSSGGGGGGAAQRVWGREQAEAAAGAAGEVWWPRACAYPECRNFSGATEAELKPKLCGGCGEARYCRPECQKLHWKAAHKQECKRRGG